MAFRQTFVVEYPDEKSAPNVSAGMEFHGGKVVAVQFNDALEELDQLAQEMIGYKFLLGIGSAEVTHLMDQQVLQP